MPARADVVLFTRLCPDICRAGLATAPSAVAVGVEAFGFLVWHKPSSRCSPGVSAAQAQPCAGMARAATCCRRRMGVWDFGRPLRAHVLLRATSVARAVMRRPGPRADRRRGRGYVWVSGCA
eukprot:11186376-Lingulodinium_polyedra.AAC.2